jgi:molecular chaperone HscC
MPEKATPEQQPGPVIVGIDLGTTMSAACVQREGELTFIENSLGETLTPSVVAYDGKARGLVVGRMAKDILATNPDQAVALFKRQMGDDNKVSFASSKYSPVELSAQVLDTLRADCERQLGQPVERCVITVPAYFGEAQRHATRQAGEMAGFIVERIVSEPTAAAMAYGVHQSDVEKTFVVLDLGGGTFDVCVMELFEGLLEVKGVAGESQLGGEDFTAALSKLVLQRAGIDSASLSRPQQALLTKRAELLKRKLSRWSSAEITAPGADAAITITREEAEVAFRPLLDRMYAPCQAALRGAGVMPSEIEDVLLVGGATRMPCFVQFAEQVFGRPPNTQQDPDHIVARGAAIQAALCANDASVADIAVTDVAAHSLGIEVVREFDGRARAGFFYPLIDRNTTIPTSRMETFSTLTENQRSLTVSVYEGEARMTKGCRHLGDLTVRRLPKGPQRDVITVRFTYDLNGILEVEARLLEKPDVVVTRLFERGSASLDKKAMERARARLRQLKADPKERPIYRDLLGRANALFEEVAPAERQTLDFGISQFEAALESRTPKEIDSSYEMLLRICTHIDDGERW